MGRLRETHFPKGPGNITYKVVGDGPLDLVVVPGWFSHVDLHWNDAGRATSVMFILSGVGLLLSGQT
jgi:hypothetical protein